MTKRGWLTRHSAVRVLRQPLEAVIGLKRIAAVADEAEHAVEQFVGQRRIGQRRAHFVEHLRLLERRGAGARHDVLREHVERAEPEDVVVELARFDRVERGARLEIFEAVARHDDRLGQLVEPVVGAPDPLEQPRRALGRAHLDHAIDIAPIDPEIEAGGRDQRAQPPVGHRLLDLAPRLAREAAVMDADRQRHRVDLPQILEDQFGQAARVAEDDRRLVRLDLGHHLFGGVAPRMPRPGHAAFGQQDRDVGVGARLALAPGRPCRYRHRARARRDSRRDRRPSPTARRGAAPARSAAAAPCTSASRSPRLPVAKAWTSSTTIVLAGPRTSGSCRDS